MQVGCTFFYQLISSEFDFYEAIKSVAQMHHGVAFKSIAISVVVNFAVKRLCIYTQIPYA